MMNMDVFTVILFKYNVTLFNCPLEYIVDTQCASVDFSGVFFEEAVTEEPWKPSANDPYHGDWLRWCHEGGA
jgi:hypothetical protein